MRKYRLQLLNCPLFENLEWEEITRVMECLRPILREVKAGESVFSPGDEASFVWVLLSGRVELTETDLWGRSELLDAPEPGQAFGYLHACAGMKTVPVGAVAAEDSVVLRLDCRRVMTTCDHSCRYHKRLARNLMHMVAGENLAYQQRARILSQRTTKEKLMAYLLEQARDQGSVEFTIPMDRQQLADYLRVERSAMSTEIGKLCKAGVIESHRSQFRLLRPEEE